MKNTMKTLIFVMMILVVLVFTACNFEINTKPTCQHKGGAATCTEKAICDICGEAYGEILGHRPEEIPAVEATCTLSGLTLGQKCTVCGGILVPQLEVAPKGHKEKIDPAHRGC